MFAADTLDAPAGNDALAVGKEYDLEQHGRRVGGSAGDVVVESDVKAGQIKFTVDEVIERVLKAAGEQLPLQVNDQKTRAGVDGLVACHVVCSITKSMRRC